MTEARRPDPGAYHWREYPLGPLGEAVSALTGVLIALAVGSGAVSALILVFAILADQAGAVSIPGTQHLIDLTARVSIGVSFAVLPVIALAATFAWGVRDTLTSAAVLRAARGGASTSAVPTPYQARAVAGPPFTEFLWGAGIAVGTGGLIWVIAMIATVAEPAAGAWVVLSVIGAGLGLLVVLIVGVLRVIRPWHARRRDQIAAHWSHDHGTAAWTAAASASPEPRRRGLGTSDARSGPGAGLFTTGAVAAMVAVSALGIAATFTHPDHVYFVAGEPADLGSRSEAFVTVLVWVAAISCVVGVALLGLAQARAGTVRARERSQLSAAVGDPRAPRPPEEVLGRHAIRRPNRLAMLLAAVAGGIFAPALAVAIIGSPLLADVGGPPGDVHRMLGPVVPTALAVVAASLALTVVATWWEGRSATQGHQLRADLMARWPVRPRVGRGPDSTEPWQVGPVMTPSDDSTRAEPGSAGR